ncbi:MAG TPA: hypothetical protein VFB54_07390 [Burkholderiales bacterium]|nr:hypothetical protein [Burkholderiales bacterium]
MSAYRLICQKLDGTCTSSERGYRTATAAAVAAPTLNRVRMARTQQPYFAIAEFDGARFVRLIDLGAAAAGRG